MRDKRTIVIKNPRLRKIRDSLRDILIGVYHAQWKEIHDARRKLLFDSDGNRHTIDDLSAENLQLFRKLQEQENELSNSLDRSILVCVSCGKGHRDMIYNKAYDAWYCTECYGLHRGHAKKLAKRKKEGAAKPQGHEEKAVDELYKTFL